MEMTLDNIKELFSKRLKTLRMQEGLSQRDLAVIIGIKQSSYEQYESKRALPQYDKLIKIAKYFDVTLEYLLGAAEYYQ